MAFDRICPRDLIGSFAPGQPLSGALFLTYCYDGAFFEEVIAPVLYERAVDSSLVISDGKRTLNDAKGLRCTRAHALHSSRVFHPKIILLVAEDAARVIIGSANLTRGGHELNLELGQAIELSRANHEEKTFFDSILLYLDGPLQREVRRTGLQCLGRIADALRDVLASIPDSKPQVQHQFLHNYETPLWGQLLAQLPHRHVARAIVVSPFFEADRIRDRDNEDPPAGSEDGSMVRQFFNNLQFTGKHSKPVVVCCQAEGGLTGLPVNKLKAHKDLLTIRTISSPTLHGKLLVLEGAGGQSREPYLAVVSGSPNFTAAALLQTPPEGNAETAVLLVLRGGKSGFEKVQGGLEIEKLFAETLEWPFLKQQPPRSLPSVEGQLVIADALLVLLGRQIELTVQSAPAGTMFLVVRTTGSRGSMEVARGPFPGEGPWIAPAPALVDRDAAGFESVVAASILVEARGEGDVLLASATVPLNIDHPEQICGFTVVGPLAVTLDDRIARSALGVPISYRDQQKMIESLRAPQKEKGGTPPGPSHQADLDRLYRNLHNGLRGLQHRFDRAPDSMYILRKSASDLAQWCKEAIIPTSGTYSMECRLYMTDRLLEAILALIEKAKRSPKLAGDVYGVATGAGLMELVTEVRNWIASSGGDDDLDPFVAKCRQKADDLAQQVGART